MALDPILWALKDAPVRSATERLILTVYAEHADDDGCNAYPSYPTVAERALCDRKTVERVAARLVTRGLLARGDQSAAAHIPARYRPVVFDVMVPLSWWGPAGVERVNRYRAGRGRDALDPQSRPDPRPAPPRTKRSDAGRPRRQGGLSVPADKPDQGGLSVPTSGDSQSRPGGTESPPTPPFNPPLNPPPSPPPAAPAPVVVDQSGGEGETAETDPTPAAGDALAALVDELRAHQPGWSATATRRALEDAAAAGREPAVVAAAARSLARGEHGRTGSPRRLLADGPWWAAAAAPVVGATDPATAERERMARTPHTPVPGRHLGYCSACGRHDTNRIHRAGPPAQRGTGDRCSHGRRPGVCLDCAPPAQLADRPVSGGGPAPAPRHPAPVPPAGEPVAVGAVLSNILPGA